MMTEAEGEFGKLIELFGGKAASHNANTITQTQ